MKIAIKDILHRLGCGVTTAIISTTLMAISHPGTLAQDDILENVVLPVSTFVVDYHDSYSTQQTFTGQITARRSSALGFERSGILSEVLVDEGATAQKGQVLAALDTRALEARRQELRSQLTAAEANVLEASAMVKLAASNRKRQTKLVEQGHVSDRLYESTEAEYDVAVARQTAADASLSNLKAALNTLDIQLDLSMIAAPFDGLIVQRYMDEGAIAGPGTPVLRIIEKDHLELRVGVSTAVARQLKPGTSYRITTDSGKTNATLETVLGEVEQKTRTVTAVFGLSANSQLRVGELGRLVLSREEMATGFWAPTTALTEGRRGMWTVFVVTEDEQGNKIVTDRQVQVIHAQSDKVFVRGMVEEGERLVAEGLHRLVTGQPVSLNENGS